MSNYVETFRGDVRPWEVDATEHFTVAYYYEKFEAATWRFLHHVGVNPSDARTVETVTHYKTELRDREIYRIESALIASGKTPSIAHRLFNAETDALCTTVQQVLGNITISAPVVKWDGDERQERPIPGQNTRWVPSLRDVVRPEETDWVGNLSLPGYIHRFSTANSFIMAAFGMTPAYMTDNRVGLSTFEFQLTFHDQAKPGDMIDIESCIALLGNSSMRFCHQMRNANTGSEIASLSQFGVQLDLDRRKPVRVSDNLRINAKSLIVVD